MPRRRKNNPTRIPTSSEFVKYDWIPHPPTESDKRTETDIKKRWNALSDIGYCILSDIARRGTNIRTRKKTAARISAA